jgi:hypothetical protein
MAADDPMGGTDEEGGEKIEKKKGEKEEVKNEEKANHEDKATTGDYQMGGADEGEEKNDDNNINT